jgi:hypothetical protein
MVLVHRGSSFRMRGLVIYRASEGRLGRGTGEDGIVGAENPG